GGLRQMIEVEGGAQQTRFVAGAQEVANRLADRVGDRLVLGTPVLAIEHDDGGAGGRPETDDWPARRGGGARPPPLAGRIFYRPGLPVLRDQLMQRVSMGTMMKIIVTYERPFWRTLGFSGEAVSTRGPVCVAFDNTSADGKEPALVAFLAGQAAREW